MSASVEGNHQGDPGTADGTERFKDLFDGVEDLIKRVAEIDSPEIQKIRAKARVALMMARSAVQDGATHVGRRARAAADSTDGYVHQYPWYALGLGTALGFGLGVLVGRGVD